ncbi:chitin deacetylase 8-like [Anticarsia gemmatalis]|uniref:chitin deacetylase 8-like n=1 Tax=Anticarsia gemmatalis TaxID=129554 RepID=UPI003F763481
MKWALVFSLLFVALAFADEDCEDCLPLAETCDVEVCKLPDCRCSITDIPGGLLPRNTPQFVTVTFDDGVNTRNIITYRASLYNRKNQNGCPAGATFFVNHEYTDYTVINELYNRGFEIALHSISHQTPQSYWAEASYEDMVKEFADQKRQMAHFGNIHVDTIKGIRIPFLQMTGNASFQMMANHGFTYDCSWPTVSFTDPALWPYTLDYASEQDCIVPPCPTASIPGTWVMPMVTWTDLAGFPCSMVDACFSPPSLTDENAWYNFILTNFERHYKGNRAPFPFFIHEAFFDANPAVLRAFIRFLNLINSLPDVFMVNAQEVLDWVKNPVPISEYRQQPCRRLVPTSCRARSCGPYTAAHNNLAYWMQVCSVCPRVYPWLGNPLGQ